jgi:KipI family sensor histidine kinase inhibitor
MPDAESVRFLSCGDTALAVEFGNEIDRSISETVLALDAALASRRIEGIVETVPTFRSLMIHYEPLTVTPETLTDLVLELIAAPSGDAQSRRRWTVPACYDRDFAPDLDDVAGMTGLSSAKVIDLHSATEFHVYMIGFLPGYPYMGDLPRQLRLPRRKDPRLRLPAGSIAIATALTAIYPVDSPGGWHLIGRSPIRLFDAGWESPSLLVPGDKVRFLPISPARFEELERQIEAGEFTPDFEMVGP